LIRYLERLKNDKMLCTAILIAINVIVFALFAGAGQLQNTAFFREYGAMYVPYVIQGGQWYRLVTSMFLHFSVEHLLFNMLMLALLGKELEPIKGYIRYLVIYFVSGIGGNLVSMVMILMTNPTLNVVSAGASGAIFGLVGATLGTMLKTQQPVGRLGRRGIIVMLIFSLYVGFTSAGVNNAAHVGGVIFGFLISLIV